MMHRPADKLEKSALAPIALFAYNRPQHLQQTVEALARNTLASESDLYIFSDGAKSAIAEEGVRKVRQYLPSIAGFRSVHTVIRENNLGLANSVIAGVTQLCEQWGRVIVLEDDAETARDFLTFLNRGLEYYCEVPGVFSLGGINFEVRPATDYEYDAFFSYRSANAAWATWANRWQRADWGVADYHEFVRDGSRRRAFSQGGDDLPQMLKRQMAGRIDSWSIRWDYAHYCGAGLALLPVINRARDIGCDGTGVHVRRSRSSSKPLPSIPQHPYRFPDKIAADRLLAAQIRKRYHRPLWKRAARNLMDQAGIK